MPTLTLCYYDDLGNRHYAISGYTLNLFRKHYGDNSIVEEEIFYYIYAILHHKGYLEKYKNSIAKEAPHIGLSEDFKELSVLGKELAKLHLNYESEELHASVEYKTLMNAEEKGYYDVETMTKKGDRIHYNNHIAITKIPKKAFDYALNGKSAIDWVIERYKKTTDKDSLIENNPNDYKGGKYVFELLCRVIKLSEKSVDLKKKSAKRGLSEKPTIQKGIRGYKRASKQALPYTPFIPKSPQKQKKSPSKTAKTP